MYAYCSAHTVFLCFLFDFLRAYIHTTEQKHPVLAENTAGYSVPVFLSELSRCKVRAYNGRKLFIESYIYYIINARNRKLIVYFSTEVINYQKLAFGILINVTVLRVLTVSKAAIFKIRYHSNRTCIQNVISSFDESTRECAREMCFAEPCCP